MRTILVVGGGYAGFYTAWKLQKKLRRGEARVIVVDPRPYMTYQPFLPEVVAGSVEVRHAAVSLEKRGARVHLNSQLLSAVDGNVVLSTGDEFDSELIVWTVGNAANPMVHNHTDLPIDRNGMLVVRPDLTSPRGGPASRRCPTPSTRYARANCWPAT